MDIKMIVCDLDGTLLRDDKTISPYTISILEKCRKNNILFGIATARTFQAAQPYIDAALPYFVVSSGGALAKIGDETVYTSTLDEDTANGLLASIRQAPDVGYICTGTPLGYFGNHPPRPPFIPISDVFSYAFSNGGAYKIVAQLSEHHSKTTAQMFPGVRCTPYSGESWVSFEHINATKWLAISAVAAHLGIGATNVAAFGDDYNDIEMLANCGIGVAMDNAITKAKAAAKYICSDNNDDGVAKWLENNLWM